MLSTAPSKKVERLFSQEGMVGGTWPAGQRSGPAEPDAAQLRPWDIRDGGRSLSVLPPDSLCQCSALAWLLSLPHSGLQMVELAECWLAPRPSAVCSRPAADLYAFGQWSVAWSRLARSPRVVGPLGLGLVVPHSELVHVLSMAVCSSEHS